MEIKEVGYYTTSGGWTAKVQAIANGIATGWLKRRDGDGGQYTMAWLIDGSWASRGSSNKRPQTPSDLVEYLGLSLKEDWPIDRECE